MNFLKNLLPNRTKQHFIECLDTISIPHVSKGDNCRADIGAVSLTFNSSDSILELDYSKTPMQCKRGYPVHGPILMQGLVANAVVLNAAFETFKDYEYLGFARTDRKTGMIGFRSGDSVVGVSSDSDGEVSIINAENCKFDKNTPLTLSVSLDRHLPDSAFERMEYSRDALRPDIS